MTADVIYLGIENYGAEEVNKDTKDNFSYRFEMDGKEVIFKIDSGIKETGKNPAYPIQNQLKEGYAYKIQFTDKMITSVEEKKNQSTYHYQPPISGVPGKRTLKNFLQMAFMPIGTTLYIYGGGWNWQDSGSAIQTRTIGLSQDWIRFFTSQDADYTYRDRDGDENAKDPANSYYPYGGYNEYYYAGLDCSGYVGWTIYNVMNTESGLDGYITSAVKMAKSFADKGWGKWTQKIQKPVNDKDSVFFPGDIFSIKGHVWICLGTCHDGSLLIMHSTPQKSRHGQPGGGPELSAIGMDMNCEAYRLADTYMSRYFPEWYARYPVALKEYNEYIAISSEYTGKFSWSLTGENGGLNDPDDYKNMTAEEILKDLFGTD